MSALKKSGGEWLVETFAYIADNPHIVVNDFFQSGIIHALDGKDIEMKDGEDENETYYADEDHDNDKL